MKVHGSGSWTGKLDAPALRNYYSTSSWDCLAFWDYRWKKEAWPLASKGQWCLQVLIKCVVIHWFCLILCFVIKVRVKASARPDSSKNHCQGNFYFLSQAFKVRAAVLRGDFSDTQGCETHQLWTRCWHRCWSRGCRRPSVRPRRCTCQSPWTSGLWCPGWWSRERCRGRSGWWPYALSSVRRVRFSASWTSAPPAVLPPPGAARGSLDWHGNDQCVRQRGCGRLYLTGNLHLTSNLDVVIVVVGVRSDPEAAFLQSCREIIPFIRAILKQTYIRQHITEGSQNGPVQNVHRFIGTGSVLIISCQLSCRDIKQNFNRNSKFTFWYCRRESAKTKQKVCCEDKKNCLRANRFRQKNPSSCSCTHAKKKRNAKQKH